MLGSGCRPCRPTRASTRCRSPTASTCCAASQRGAAGEYAVAVKLATVVFVACAASSTRGRRWPTRSRATRGRAAVLARDDLLRAGDRRGRRARVALLGRWMVRLLAAPEYFGAYRALPWLALGWALYGLYLVLIVITGRARVTQRNLPAAAGRAGGEHRAAVPARPQQRRGLGLAGAGIALCGAYAVMVVVMHLLTRGVFAVGFQWRRLAQLTAIFAGGRRLRRAAAAAPAASPVWRCASPGSRSSRRCCWSRAFRTPTSAPRPGRSSPTAGGASPRSGPGTARSRHTPRTRLKDL